MAGTLQFGYSIIHYLPSPELKELGSRLLLALVVLPIGDNGPGKLYALRGKLEKIGEFGLEEHVGFVKDALDWIGDSISTVPSSETAFNKIKVLLAFADSIVTSSPLRKVRAESIDQVVITAGFNLHEFDLVYPDLPMNSTTIQ